MFGLLVVSIQKYNPFFFICAIFCSLAKMFISSNNFFVHSLEASTSRIISPENKDSLSSFFLLNLDTLHFFLFFSLSFALSKASSIIFNRSVKVGYLCVFPDLRKKAFSLSSLLYDVNCGFFIDTFVRLRIFLSNPPGWGFLSRISVKFYHIFFFIYWVMWLFFYFINDVFHQLIFRCQIKLFFLW